MIDIANEEPIALRNVPSILPATGRGKRLQVSAVYRWVQRGLDGVKLEVIRIGGRRYTSVEALQRFAEHRTQPHGQGSVGPATSPVRQRQVERAATQVEKTLGTTRRRPKP